MTENSETARPGLLRRAFPEKRIFVKSESGTRFVRLGPRQHLLAGAAILALVSWSVVATTYLVIDVVKGAGAHQAVATEKALYERRIQDLADERDRQRAAALEAQHSYDEALGEVSGFQDRIFASDMRIRELEQTTAALQRLLKQSMGERDSAEAKLAVVDSGNAASALDELERRRAEAEKTAALLTDALDRTSAERDTAQATASQAGQRLAELEEELDAQQSESDRIFAQLEDAMTLAVKPLDKMFRQVGLEPDKLIDDVRSETSGEGGPLSPIAFSTKGFAPTPDELRAKAVMDQMDLLTLYKMAADKIPFAIPVEATVRQTSGFGYRSDPFRRGKRLHAGLDWAGAYGTPIYASADGVVIFAGRESGYGRLIRIQHEFGIETRFAHLSKIEVKVGQRVSRGDRIGAMGNSGRSTGTHLHYEVRVGGAPVDPLIYIKAARDVL